MWCWHVVILNFRCIFHLHLYIEIVINDSDLSLTAVAMHERNRHNFIYLYLIIEPTENMLLQVINFPWKYWLVLVVSRFESHYSNISYSIDDKSTLIQIMACCLMQQAIIWINVNLLSPGLLMPSLVQVIVLCVRQQAIIWINVNLLSPGLLMPSLVQVIVLCVRQQAIIWINVNLLSPGLLMPSLVQVIVLCVRQQAIIWTSVGQVLWGHKYCDATLGQWMKLWHMTWCNWVRFLTTLTIDIP